MMLAEPVEAPCCLRSWLDCTDEHPLATGTIEGVYSAFRRPRPGSGRLRRSALEPARLSGPANPGFDWMARTADE